LRGAVAFVEAQIPTIRAAMAAKATPEKKDAAKADKKPPVTPAVEETPESRAVANFCQALLGSNEFLYVD
jgi:hypothetical protein